MAKSTTRALHFTGDPDADAFLVSEPLALLMGMLLDQQVPMERAFHAPFDLRERLGGLDAHAIAAMHPDDLAAVFSRRPALHRFPASMAVRVHQLCQRLVDEYGGRAERVWEHATSADDLFARLRRLPGFGDEKARIFVTILGRRLGLAPEGWERHAVERPSVADVASADDIPKVREAKRLWKASQATPS